MHHVTPKEAAKILGVHVSSLRRWENEGKLKAIRTPGGQRRFILENESYTSKTCGNCGHVHYKLGGNKVFKCPHCGIQICRDVNGARNILLRALQATAFTVTHDEIMLSEESELTDAVVNLV
ncbi:zinc ribbon domain-containing protein [Anabaenopsis sp. FSS-46]|uniref:zinc ribbon domain-containing protein n=1 Tax=Anabaenopsis sp. FSS-46 TaxID=2971766 RepID=UPI0024759A2B|nr:zinc ribbon domain-containing protein [Anabaenopsis sp. FSS-46]MDH6100459.1 zinc ribbon domain-containing protein [Anabaenopsis sp. FSS-46]